jgi:hypothetical protein
MVGHTETATGETPVPRSRKKERRGGKEPQESRCTEERAKGGSFQKWLGMG